MNVVILAPFAFSPKATVSARTVPMAAALVRRGHRATVLIPPYDNVADSGKAWERDGVRLENLELKPAKGNARWLGLARRMALRALALKPDVVYVFKPIGPGALAAWMLWNGLGLRRERRIVVDTDDWEGAGGWLDVNPYSRAQKRALAWQERWCLRHARAVTCASDVLAQRTRRMRGTAALADASPASDVTVFPNGPDTSLREEVARAAAHRDALRAELGWTDKRVVVYSGTVPLNHDLDVATQAILKLSVQATMKLRLVFVVTGAGVPSLQKLIDDAPVLSAMSEFHGFMPREHLADLLTVSDIAIYPYRDSNINRAKCSGKVIDYMTCGLPMVLSDVGMNSAYVEHGVSGLLTAPGDVSAFRDALASLIDDPARARAMGAQAQARVWSKFDWDARADMLERELLGVASNA